jgi:hypothetical protein
MPPVFFARGLLLAMLAAVLVLPGPTAAAGPGYHRPKVGECHNYDVSGSLANSEDSDPVPCKRKHKAVTVAVLRVPKRVGLADPDRTFAALGSRCYKAFNSKLGGNTRERAMTAYALVWFMPTEAERDQGARWIRCDLILNGGTKLQAVPKRLLPQPLKDSVRLCLLINNGSLLGTVCSRKHGYRAAGVVMLGGRYPGFDKFQDIADKRCPRITGKNSYFYYPGKEAWQAGDKRITCLKRSRG